MGRSFPGSPDLVRGARNGALGPFNSLNQILAVTMPAFRIATTSSNSACVSKASQTEIIPDSGAEGGEASSPASSSAAQGLKGPLNFFMNFVAAGSHSIPDRSLYCDTKSHSSDRRRSAIICHLHLLPQLKIDAILQKLL